MSLINRRKHEAFTAIEAPEVSQQIEDEPTPRQQVQARIAKLRKDSNYGIIWSASCGIMSAGYLLQGESNPFIQTIEELGASRQVAYVVSVGMTCLTGALSIYHGVDAASSRAEAISLDAGMRVNEVLAAEQAEQMVAMPQPELVWKHEQA